MKEHKYYIKSVRQPTNDLLIVELADRRGRPVFEFTPGQYVMIRYRNKQGKMEQKHTFSIASSPTEKHIIRLGIRIIGPFTQGLLGLEVGDEILVHGPFGDFTFNEDKYLDLVMIAGGIGITPFYSTLKYAADHGLPNKLSLIYSARTIQGTAFFNEIRQLEMDNHNLRAMFSVTDEKIVPGKGLVGEKITASIMKEFIGPVQGKTFFICGPQKFMEAMKANLYGIGVDKSQIETEDFSMFTDNNFWLKTRNLSYATGVSAAMFILSFYLIGQTAQGVATTGKQSKFDAAKLYQLNKSVSDRMLAIAADKNKAIADLVAAQVAASKLLQTSATAAPSTTQNRQNTTNVKLPAVAKPAAVAPAANVQQPVSSQPNPIVTNPPVTQNQPPVVQPPTPTTAVS
jgi:ferredoxin-NADP reductase